MHRLLFSLLVPLVLPALPSHAAEAPGVTISAAPERPIVEQRGDGHLLNFDMIVRNKGNQTYRIAKIELSVYDSGGVLAARKALNTDAFAPSITVIGEQLLAPGKSLDIFNPFSQFKPAMPLARLRYDFCLLREDTPAQRDANRHRLPDDCDFVSSLAVTPRTYAGKTPLMLPVRGKVFVWEGHDFYAHHLRVPLGNPRMASMGIAANSNEFANDFIYTDAEGNAYRGDPRTLTNWHSYGKPLYAPGAGSVREAVGDIPDNQFGNAAATSIVTPHLPPGKDPQDLGNHVLIDHGNGEFSLLLHMKPGSVTVKADDRVAQGQQIGAIGFTGDAIFPHLHYVLMEGPQTGKSWGLPTYFSHFRRYFGAASQEVSRDSINSGDFVESDAYP